MRWRTYLTGGLAAWLGVEPTPKPPPACSMLACSMVQRAAWRLCHLWESPGGSTTTSTTHGLAIPQRPRHALDESAWGPVASLWSTPPSNGGTTPCPPTTHAFLSTPCPPLPATPPTYVAVTMSATAVEAEAEASAGGAEKDPLLLRAARGEKVERSPVWMMRQAGRHMQVYRDLCAKYPTFRERSEIPEVSLEISLQPWRAYKTDGVILFSDILTPLPGMNVEFDIDERRGPVVEPYRTQERVDTMTKMDPEEACPFVGSVLRDLRKEVGNEATVLGFVGLPYTLATYLVEGQVSRLRAGLGLC